MCPSFESGGVIGGREGRSTASEWISSEERGASGNGEVSAR